MPNDQPYEEAADELRNWCDNIGGRFSEGRWQASEGDRGFWQEGPKATCRVDDDKLVVSGFDGVIVGVEFESTEGIETPTLNATHDGTIDRIESQRGNLRVYPDTGGPWSFTG